MHIIMYIRIGSPGVGASVLHSQGGHAVYTPQKKEKEIIISVGYRGVLIKILPNLLGVWVASKHPIMTMK